MTEEIKKPAEVKKEGEQKPGEGTGADEKDTNDVFLETLGELYAKDEEKAKAAAGDGTGTTAQTAPSKPAAETKPKAGEGQTGFSEEDQKLLTAWGIPLDKADPQVVTAIKKKAQEIEATEGRVKDAEGRATRYASQNKQVSEQYQGLKKDHKALLDRMATDPSNVGEFAKKLFTEEELAKLPKETQDILRDEGARLAFTMLVTKMAQLGQQNIDAAAHGDGTITEPSTAQTGDPLNQNGAGAQQPQLSPEQVKVRDEWINKTMADAGYGNYAEIYASPDFKEYMDPIIKTEIDTVLGAVKAGIPLGNIDPELALIVQEANKAGIQIPNAMASRTFRMLRTDAPQNHISILRGFSSFKTAKSQAAEAQATADRRSGALEGHGETKPQPTTAGKTMAELNPDEITALSTKEFKRLSQDKTARTTEFG